MSKTYLLKNKSKKIITIAGVRLMVGINKITHEQYEAMAKSRYFAFYFEDTIAKLPAKVADKCEAHLEWDAKINPENLADSKKDSTGYEILELTTGKFKKTIKEIYDLAFLEELLAEAKSGDYKLLIKEQMAKVIPSASEINDKE